MRKSVIYILLLLSVSAFAQKERSMARKGNRFYNDSAFAEAEIAYRKALDENANLREAQFNLADAAIRQEKFDEAIEQLEVLASTSDDKMEQGDIYHNMGNAFLGKYQTSLQDQEKAKSAGEELDKSINAFKQSLRNNPSDNETRYNLAVAQKLKEEGPPQQQEQEQEEQDQDKQDQDKDKEQQEQQQQDEEQQQDQEQQPQPDKISKEDAEKILNAMMQEEKELQEDQKEKQKANARSRRVEKDW